MIIFLPKKHTSTKAFKWSLYRFDYYVHVLINIASVVILSLILSYEGKTEVKN